MPPHVADASGSLRGVHTQRIFRNAENLACFFSDCIGRPQVAYSVEMVLVSLHERSLSTALLLQTVLSSMINVTDLILELPHTFPSVVLVDVHLPQLTLFKSNIPHSNLVGFLLHHSGPQEKLRSLSLGHCGRSSACPLRACLLENMVELQCKMECASALMRPRVNRLVLELHQESTLASSTFKQLAPSSLLDYLSIEVPTSQREVLKHIPTFAPELYSLMVHEVALNGESTSLRSIMSDHEGWAYMLRGLPRLDTLLVRTPLFKVTAGDAKEEKKMIMRWLCGSYESRPRYDRAQNLRRVGLHYGPQTGGVMSHWRLFEEWERYAYVPSTDVDNYLV